MIEITKEMGEYVAWAPDCLLVAFGQTAEEARDTLLVRAADSLDELRGYRDRDKLSQHLAATIPAIARLLESSGRMGELQASSGANPVTRDPAV